MRLCRAAVICQHSKTCICHTHLVVVCPARQSTCSARADQVEGTGSVNCAADVVGCGRGTCALEVAKDYRVVQGDGADRGIDTTAITDSIVIVVRTVISHGHVGQCCRS